MPKEIAPGLTVETVGDLLENSAAAPQGAVSQPGETPPTPSSAGDPSDNERVRLGGNNPPEDIRTPFDVIKDEINDLYCEARNWLDGEAIERVEQADEIGRLRDMLRDAKKRADAQRVAENEPFDKGKAEVQARYNPLIQKDRGIVDLAIQSCNNALAPFLKKLDDQRIEDAKKLKIAADEKAAAALKLAQEAAQTANLETRENAEDAIKAAKDALRVATRVDKAKTQVGGLNRNIGMKSVWTATLTDPAAALLHYRTANPAGLKQWLRDQAAADVRSGTRSLPGFNITEDRVPS